MKWDICLWIYWGPFNRAWQLPENHYQFLCPLHDNIEKGCKLFFKNCLIIQNHLEFGKAVGSNGMSEVYHILREGHMRLQSLWWKQMRENRWFSIVKRLLRQHTLCQHFLVWGCRCGDTTRMGMMRGFQPLAVRPSKSSINSKNLNSSMIHREMSGYFLWKYPFNYSAL